MSLGEEGGIPEANFWQWKHEQNPFGVSPTLLAWDGDTLVGLRTFLSWQFRQGEELIQAYRAVDTATHRDYRGQGIFKTLTLGLINQLKMGTPSLIFNTPNQQSKPGYLKMGWQEFGKTPLWVRWQPTYLLRNRFVKVKNEGEQSSWQTVVDNWPIIEPAFRQLTRELITTHYSLAYLQWRYRDIPDFIYQWRIEGADQDRALVFYRMKSFGGLRELRVTDVFFSSKDGGAVKKAVKHLIDQHKPDVVTVLCDERGLLRGMLPFGFIPIQRAGLSITYREINDASLTALAKQRAKWFFTSGSIELL
jgi:hypothetical protein